MNKKKTIIISSIIIGVLVLTLGLTYAAITFNETKGNSQLVLGDIWMHYKESDTSINITDLMPSENYTNDYFEFTIDGKNTYDKKDIWYEIVLSHGDYEGDDLNRTIRIDDQLLKFKLVEVVDGEEVEIFGNRTYSDLTNKRIHVDTISSSDNNYSKTYRLYMRLAEYTNICMGDATDGCDYYINPSSEYANLDWDKLFASIKVNVTGDFEEKSIETPGSCFTYKVTSIENPTVNSVMVSQEVVENELIRCVNYFDMSDAPYDVGSNGESFCKGTGTVMGGLTLQQLWDNTYQQEGFMEQVGNELVNNNIMILENGGYVVNPVMADQEYNELTKCVNYFSNNSDLMLSDGEDWESFCKGTGTLNGNTFQTSIDNGNLENYVNELASIKVITGTSGTIDLTSYDDSCGEDVVIPREIDGYHISKISGTRCDYEYSETIFDDKNVKNVILQDNIVEISDCAFADVGVAYGEEPKLNIRSIEIPNSVVEIGFFAFMHNQLNSIYFQENSNLSTIGDGALAFGNLKKFEIPNSVTFIGYLAFDRNKLTSITIPNSVTSIGYQAFSGNPLESITFEGKTCDEMEDFYFEEFFGYGDKYPDIYGTDGECIY